jgi:hypothetical protein
MSKSIIWANPFLIISSNYFDETVRGILKDVVEKEFEAVLFEQCCEVRYPNSKGLRSAYPEGSSRFPKVLPGGL